MHEPQTVQRFIELRAQGWTYARLMTELNVSKPTLIVSPGTSKPATNGRFKTSHSEAGVS
jgi:orotate phosphoribosyltransferase-like protein